MEGETKYLLESNLEPCQTERSHVSLAIGANSQPKEDNLLLLDSLDSADNLDVAAAQPLLTGGLPKKVQTSPVHQAERILAEDAIVSPIGAPHRGLISSKAETESQVTQGREGPGGVLGVGGPSLATSGTGGMFVASLDEFPPLEKGQFLKMKNRFEIGLKSRANGLRSLGSGARDSGFGSGQPAREDRVADVVDNSAGTSTEPIGTETCHAAGSVGHA